MAFAPKSNYNNKNWPSHALGHKQKRKGSTRLLFHLHSLPLLRTSVAPLSMPWRSGRRPSHLYPLPPSPPLPPPPWVTNWRAQTCRKQLIFLNVFILHPEGPQTPTYILSLEEGTSQHANCCSRRHCTWYECESGTESTHYLIFSSAHLMRAAMAGLGKSLW